MTDTTRKYKKQAARIVANLMEYNLPYGGHPDATDILDIIDSFNNLMTQDGVKETIAGLEQAYPEEDRDDDINEILDDMRRLLDYDSRFHVYEDYVVVDRHGFLSVVYIVAPIRTANGKLTGYRITMGLKDYDAELIKSTQNCEYLKFSEEIGGTGYTYVISSRDLDVE